MKRKKSIVMCLLLLVLLAFPVSAQAASQKKKALKAYEKFLTKETVGFLDGGGELLNVPMAACRFALAYVDNNSVPELVVYSPEIEKLDWGGGLKYGGDYYGCYIVYTYKNGKVKRTARTQLVKFAGYYKKEGVLAERYTIKGGLKENHYILKKGKLKEAFSRSKGAHSKNRIYRNDMKQTVISKAAYEKGLKSLTGGRKLTKVKFRANTAANRKKYLK